MELFQHLFKPRPTLEPMRDMHQVAIDTLLAKGTPFATGLALEIDRGRKRRDHTEPWSRAQHEAQSMVERDNRELMLTQLRPAEPGEYATWVQGWFQAGGRSFQRITSATPQIWVATKHLDVHPLHGAKALQIIVPEGIDDNGGDTGHTDLFILREGRYLQRGFHDQVARTPRNVPIYSDMNL
jgi:hypothetical protein